MLVKVIELGDWETSRLKYTRPRARHEAIPYEYEMG